MKIHLPKTVAAAQGGIAKVQGGGTAAAYSLAVEQERFELDHGRFHFFPHAVREAGHNQAADEFFDIGNMKTLAIHERTEPAGSAEQLIAAGIVHGAAQHVAGMLEGN